MKKSAVESRDSSKPGSYLSKFWLRYSTQVSNCLQELQRPFRLAEQHHSRVHAWRYSIFCHAAIFLEKEIGHDFEN